MSKYSDLCNHMRGLLILEKTSDVKVLSKQILSELDLPK